MIRTAVHVRSRVIRSQPLGTTVAAVAAALVLAGCGGRGDSLHSAVAAAKTTLSQTAWSNLELDGASAFGRADAPILGKGAFVFSTGLAYEAVDLQGVRDQEARTQYLVFLPTKIYVQPRAATGPLLPKGKNWLSIPLTGPGAAKTGLPQFAEQVEGLNPELLLDEIVWGARSVRHVGEPVVDHVPYSEYVVSVDLRRALDAATGPSAEAMRTAIRQELAALRGGPGGNRSSTVPITVWVDGPGRAVRLKAAVPGSGLGTVSMVLSDFGAKIPKNLPLPPEVVEIGSLPAGASGAGSAWPLGASS